MDIILMRHAEPDYDLTAHKPGFGHLTPLSEAGIEQAKEAAKNPLLEGAEVIISSPFTRALQTAAVLSKELGLELIVDVNFHERLADLQNALRTEEDVDKSFEEYDALKGIYGDKHHWESIDMQTSRLKASLDKYTNYDKIIIVTHGELIRRLKPVRLPFCGTAQIAYDSNFSFLGWS